MLPWLKAEGRWLVVARASWPRPFTYLNSAEMLVRHGMHKDTEAATFLSSKRLAILYFHVTSRPHLLLGLMEVVLD